MPQRFVITSVAITVENTIGPIKFPFHQTSLGEVDEINRIMGIGSNNLDVSAT